MNFFPVAVEWILWHAILGDLHMYRFVKCTLKVSCNLKDIFFVLCDLDHYWVSYGRFVMDFILNVVRVFACEEGVPPAFHVDYRR